MRGRTVLMTLAFILSLAIGVQLVSQVQSRLIDADVDIDPDALNLRSEGKFVTVYIELPVGYNVADIVLETVYLETIQAVTDSKYGFVSNPEPCLTDHDCDGILERVVKFSREDLISLLLPHMTPIAKQEATLTLRGRLKDGTEFQGSDTISVIFN